MSLIVRRSLATAGIAGVALLGFAAPASAQQTGLVNVEISNVLNGNTVQVAIPISAAANICGVSVLSLTTTTTCTSRSGNQTVTLV